MNPIKRIKNKPTQSEISLLEQKQQNIKYEHITQNKDLLDMQRKTM